MSSQKVPCCKKCEDLTYCRTSASCCVECHFAYEERVAAPYLPPSARAWLRAQHEHLKSSGYPPLEVERHAIEEMRLYRKHCPSDIVELIMIDHVEYEGGRLRVRDAPA